MPAKRFDRRKLIMKPLAERKNRVRIESDHVPVSAVPQPLSEIGSAILDETVARIRAAKSADRSRILCFGAHTIKNGLAPVLIGLIEQGWITHLATNGAGIIHDWEFAFQGESSEHVQENMEQGQFGAWEETGFYLNLALAAGAYSGLGYGESIGALVENEGLSIPSPEELAAAVAEHIETDPAKAAAAIDLLDVVRSCQVRSGDIVVPHPFKRYGVQAAAYRLAIPFTGHPMIGHDILYLHPANRCAAVGRTAERDFLTFAHAAAGLDGGVYLSVGSAVMSPMIFEKALAMAQNVAKQEARAIDNHFLVVVDLAKSHWDWTQGEPPENNPDYYLRYNKTFARMGGTMRYVCADNRDFLLGLYQRLQGDSA